MEVELHTKIKHLILGYYFNIVGKNVFRSSRLYSWYYADLYCGDGVCVCNKIEPHILELIQDENVREWESPFFKLFNYAKNADLKLTCYFNDTNSERVNLLKQKLKLYKDYVGLVGNSDANEWYKVVLENIKSANKPGFFFLDPTNHAHLKFSTIKGISEFKGNNGKMPELIINLMTFTMLLAIRRKYESGYQTITDSLGTDEWRTQLREFQERQKTHELFLEIFIKQLNKLGYSTSYYQVNSVGNAPLYYLVFATTNRQAEQIHKNMEPYIKKLQNKKWVKAIAKIDYLIRALPVQQTRLSKFPSEEPLES